MGDVYLFNKIMKSFLLFILGILIVKVKAADPDSISIIIDQKSSQPQDFIQIPDPPSLIKGNSNTVHVNYRCTDERMVGIEIISDVFDVSNRDSGTVLFQKIWRCHGNTDGTKSRTKKIKIKLPDNIAFNFNHFNKHVSLTANTKLRAWIVEPKWTPMCFRQSQCYFRSFVKVSYNSAIVSPYERSYKDLSARRICKSWGWYPVFYASSFKIPSCPKEKEVVEMVRYPLVLGGGPYGVIRHLEPFTNAHLEQRRQAMVERPRLTVSAYLYILEYCPRYMKLCSVFHHFNWHGDYHSILMFITSNGMLHVQAEHTDGSQTAGLANFPLPLHSWIWTILTFDVDKWTLVVKYGTDFNETFTTWYTYAGAPIYYDDTEGLWAFGGSEYRNSFRGYIGQASLYRNKALQADQIGRVSRFHPMFELKLAAREVKCEDYLSWVHTRFHWHRNRRQRTTQGRDTCRLPFLDLMMSLLSKKHDQPLCDMEKQRPSRQRRLADKIIRDMATTGSRANMKLIANSLFQNATQLLDEGMDRVPRILPMLKQAACCGNLDAMFYVSVVLNNGIYVRADEIQSQAYLMLAALENHRLSLLALGHKHRYGIDGVPPDMEQSFGYFKFVADSTRNDKDRHKDTDVYTESIRLTDELALHEQTDEDGDIFQWLTLQAKQGVLSAQTRMARLLFWGQGGLQRNLAAAVEYYRMGAETGDSQSQYDYGITLLRGQGTQRDKDAGMEQIQKAAAQKNPAAINAVGWHAMHYEDNMEKAREHFERADRMGSPDAAYNLGTLHLHGTYPGRDKDPDLALRYFYKAGRAGQMDAGVAIAYQTIKGTDRQQRNVYEAVEWARFIAEKNPAIGLLLRKAVKAYRAGKLDVALLYYTLAADAGLEVASFNMAYLCEANHGGVTSFIEKECVWSKYNITVHREIQFVDPYALIKMGDFYWYGCEGHRNPDKAAQLYAEAARKQEPQALFNLGFMVEEGVRLPRSVLLQARIPYGTREDNVTLLIYLYNKCRESRQSEAYIPCSIALWRVQILHFWHSHQLFIKILSVAVLGFLSVLSSLLVIRSHGEHAPTSAI